MWRTKLHGLLVLAATVLIWPVDGQAQDLAGWSLIHTSVSYEYLVSFESVVRDPSAGDPTSVRLFLSRMLTREVALERSGIVLQREAVGLPVDGYDRYASTTEVVEIRCAEQQLRLAASTDFDADGQVLAESLGGIRWQTASAYADSAARRALLEWACDRR